MSSGDLFQALRTSHSGLIAQQAALDSVAQNVANANTVGYSRKVVHLNQVALDGKGSGVIAADLTRHVDDGLMRTLRIELGTLGTDRVQGAYHARLQDMLGSPESDSSLSHALTQFQGAVETLAATPENGLSQAQMVRWAEALAGKLNGMSDTIQGLRAEADQQLGKTVTEINDLLAGIADLNTKIIRNINVGHEVLDLQDQRDLSLDRLSELLDIRIYQRPRGDVVVFSAQGRTLIDGDPVQLTHVPVATASATTTYPSGGIEGIYIGDPIPANDITAQIHGGEAHGLIDLRDKILPDLQSGLDELTSKLQGSVNRIHNRGIAFPGLGAFSGTTAFATPAVSEISLAAGDVALLQFDANGEEVAGTTLNTLMTAVPLAANGPWTIDEVVSAIDGWLGANGVAALDADGKLQITMTAGGGRTLAFRDQASATRGSAFQDARIQFDTDADGTPEQTVDGFSFFFGLNDFFVDQATGTAGVAETVAVRADLVAAPNLVSRGRVQWDPTRNVTGRYHVSTGEGSIATDMAQALAADDTFDAAGGLAQIRTTYADYGSLIVGLSADLAQANESQAGFQGELVTALRHKSDTVRGVNIDEELSDLILYEQAYSAAARVITSIQQMFEALERSMG